MKAEVRSVGGVTVRVVLWERQRYISFRGRNDPRTAQISQLWQNPLGSPGPKLSGLSANPENAKAAVWGQTAARIVKKIRVKNDLSEICSQPR